MAGAAHTACTGWLYTNSNPVSTPPSCFGSRLSFELKLVNFWYVTFFDFFLADLHGYFKQCQCTYFQVGMSWKNICCVTCANVWKYCKQALLAGVVVEESDPCHPKRNHELFQSNFRLPNQASI